MRGGDIGTWVRRTPAAFDTAFVITSYSIHYTKLYDHFGDTIARSVLFAAFYLLQLEALTRCRDTRLGEIAARAVKEIRYHSYNFV